MPTIVEVSDEDLQRLLGDGGLKPATLNRRNRFYQELAKFVFETHARPLEDYLHCEEGRKVFSDALSRFFFQLRVKNKNGDLLVPKKNTLAAYKSGIRMEVKERHKVDIFDGCLFPELDKLWRSVDKMLANEGRSETKHHDEVDPATMRKIYNLLNLLEDLMKSRGTPEYESKLVKLPAEHHAHIHKLLQWGAMFILTMFEVRRGAEGMETLEVKHFEVFEDSFLDFKYMRKVVSEVEKNQQMGSNSACHGVIPDMLIDDVLNPFSYMQTYLRLLPTEAHKEKGKNFLFPMCRTSNQAKFNPHDPQEKLYEQNKKIGKNTIGKMLPQLCEATGCPKQSNHSIRTTMIKYMRRKGFSWEDIVKITGHRSTMTLVRNYDLNMETPGLAKVAGALANGPREAMGEEMALVTPSRRKAAPTFGTFLGQDSAKRVRHGSALVERECETGTSEMEFLNGEKLTVAKKKSLQLDDAGTSKSVVDSKLGSSLLSGLSSRRSSSKSPESELRLSQTHTRGSHFSCNPPSQSERSLSSQMNRSREESRGKTQLDKSGGQSRMSLKAAEQSITRRRPLLLAGLPGHLSASKNPDASKKSRSPTLNSQTPSLSQSSLMNSTPGESREKAIKSGGRSRMSGFPKAPELSNPQEFDLASQIFTQSSPRVSGSQKSTTQKSYSQLSQLSGFRIPRQRSNGTSNLARAELDRAAAHIMGSVARGVMEGSASMVKEYIDAVRNTLGHD